MGKKDHKKDQSPPVPTLLPPGRAEGEGVTSTRHAMFTVPTLDHDNADVVIDVLSDRLRALIDLMLTLKHVHWNVVGPGFIGVHTMLDPQVAATMSMVDETAERIATTGGSPNGLSGAIVRSRDWDDYSIGRATTQAHLAALDLVYTGVITSHRQAITQIGHLDPIAEDMLIGQTRILEQHQWFCRAHLEDAAGGLSHAGTATEVEAATKASNRNRNAGRPRAS
jgi:starvation-inducible DNA-binding protein